jgi:hypothetical protein
MAGLSADSRYGVGNIKVEEDGDAIECLMLTH